MVPTGRRKTTIMTRDDSDTPAIPLDVDYVLQRSEAEAIRAIAAIDPRAAAAHDELCRRYVDLAIARLTTPADG